MKKKITSKEKSVNKKLSLNKQRISQLSEGNLEGAKGGRTLTMPEFCPGDTYDWKCEKTKLITACYCDSMDWKRCELSVRICIAKK